MGEDTLVGGEGSDLITGGADNDILKGYSGDDTSPVVKVKTYFQVAAATTSLRASLATTLSPVV